MNKAGGGGGGATASGSSNPPPGGLGNRGGGGGSRRKGFAYFDPSLLEVQSGILEELKLEFENYEGELVAERGMRSHLEGELWRISNGIAGAARQAGSINNGLAGMSLHILFEQKRKGFPYFAAWLIELGSGILEELRWEFLWREGVLKLERKRRILLEEQIRKAESAGEVEGNKSSGAAGQEDQAGAEISAIDAVVDQAVSNGGGSGEEAVSPFERAPEQQPVGVDANGSVGEGGPSITLPPPDSTMLLGSQSPSLSLSQVKRGEAIKRKLKVRQPAKKQPKRKKSPATTINKNGTGGTGSDLQAETAPGLE